MEYPPPPLTSRIYHDPQTREWMLEKHRAPLLQAHRFSVIGVTDAGPEYFCEFPTIAATFVGICHHGAGEYWDGTGWHAFHPGEAVICPTGTACGWRPQKGGAFRLAWLVIEEEGWPVPFFPLNLITRLQSSSLVPWNLIELICQETWGKARSSVLEPLIDLLRLYAHGLTDRSYEDERISALWRKVAPDLGRAWTLRELARHAGMGIENFRLTSRRSMGRSPMDHLAFLRLRRAAHVLSHSGESVEEIGRAVGYDNPPAFSRAFRKQHGVSPGAFRAQSHRVELSLSPSYSLAEGVLAQLRQEPRPRTPQEPYLRAAQAVAKDWEALDLSKDANRALRHGPHRWFDDDNPSLPTWWKPSQIVLNGVPFRLLPESTEGSASGVFLRSDHLPASDSHPLPGKVVIPWKGQMECLYVLHSAGWVRSRHPLAWYILHYADGETHRVPVVAAAAPPPDENLWDEWLKSSLVQDWWTTFRPILHEQARPVVLDGPGSSTKGRCHLYTCEIVNPRPRRSLKALSLETADPQAGSLVVLAMTVLRS